MKLLIDVVFPQAMKSYWRNFSLSYSFKKYPKAPQAQIYWSDLTASSMLSIIIFSMPQTWATWRLSHCSNRGIQMWTPNWRQMTSPERTLWNSVAGHIWSSHLPCYSLRGKKSVFLNNRSHTSVLNSLQATKISCCQRITQEQELGSFELIYHHT